MFDDIEDDELDMKELTDSSELVPEDYEPLKLNEKILELKKKSKEIVDSIAELYLDKDLQKTSAYIKMMCESETMVVRNLLLNIAISEHMMTTLMRKIEAGLHTNLKVYEQIYEMQDKTVNMSLQINRYLRQIPDFFKYMNAEMSNAIESKLQKIHEIECEEELELIEEANNKNLVPSSNKDKEVVMYRGSKELIEDIEGEMDELNVDELEGESYKGIKVEGDFVVEKKDDSDDMLIKVIARRMFKENHASISMVQKLFQLPFKKSKMVMDELHDLGIISKSEGTKKCDILVNTSEELEGELVKIETDIFEDYEEDGV